MIMGMGMGMGMREASALWNGEFGEEHVVFVRVHEFFGVPFFLGRQNAFLKMGISCQHMSLPFLRPFETIAMISCECVKVDLHAWQNIPVPATTSWTLR